MHLKLILLNLIKVHPVITYCKLYVFVKRCPSRSTGGQVYFTYTAVTCP